MSDCSSRSVSLEQLVALNDEIAALVRGGVPLELGLREMGTLAGGAMGQISTALAGRMQTGVSLSDALRAEGDRIPTVYRTVVEAGLRAGRLAVALESMSNFGRELLELRRQISSALVYPLIVFALAYGLFLVFTVDLIERFRETYELFRFPMHTGLQWLVWISDRVATWWWGPPAVVIGMIVWWWSTGSAHILSFSGTARPLGWVPGLGRIGRYFQYANFAELLALLIEHQVPLADGLRLSADATGDERLKKAAHRMADAVARGDQSPASEAAFPPFLDWVLRQGARGGSPARLLRHAAGFYRRRAVNLAHWFRLTFPMLAAVLIGGGITTLYALALFGPMGSLLRDLVLDR
jgi:general secretion pathway protein F